MPIDSLFIKKYNQTTCFLNNDTKISADKDQALSPIDYAWDSFFFSDKTTSSDFMNERASQKQTRREAF